MADAEAVNIHTTTIGQGPSPALMIHSSLGRLETMLPLATLIGATYTTTLFDMPGHGGSADWDGRSGDYHGDVTHIAAGLAQPGSHVIGHSFGATVALRLALEYPEKVARLTLIEPVLFAAATTSPAHAQHTASFAPFITAYEADDLQEAARIFSGLWGGGQAWDKLLPQQRSLIAGRIHLVAESAGVLDQDSAGMLAPGRLEKLTCPVTLIAGGNSPPVIAAIHAVLAIRLRRKRKVTIEKAGHMVPITHPDAVADAILADPP